MFDKHKIEPGILVQNPLKRTSLAITGVGVEALRPDLPTLMKRFPAFKLTLGPQSSHVYTKYLNWNPALVVAKISPEIYKTPPWKVEDAATVELLISAEQMSAMDPNAGRAVYAVINAHLFLNATQRKSFAAVNYNLDMARVEIEGKTSQTSFAIGKRGRSNSLQDVQNNLTQNPSEVFGLKHPPLFSYRHWYSASAQTQSSDEPGNGYGDPMDITMDIAMETAMDIDEPGNDAPEECRDIYMNDVGLLAMETWQADRVQQTLKAMQPKRLERLKTVDKKFLKEICQRKQAVAIGNATGHMSESPHDLHGKQEESKQTRYAMHLTFIITSTDSNGHTQ